MTATEKGFIFILRMLMAWTFLYAASHQVFVPGWSVAGFLNKTKTFHDLFAVFTGPSVAPVITFLVGYGHLLIGLSLLRGVMVRRPRNMEWPYESHWTSVSRVVVRCWDSSRGRARGLQPGPERGVAFAGLLTNHCRG